MPAKTQPQPEFSRRVALQDLGEVERVEALEATAEERKALAERFGLVSLDRLTATLRLRREAPAMIRVAGRFEATVTQTCVVSLEPVKNDLDQSFSLLYSEADPDGDSAPAEILVELDEEDPPEPVPPEGIDLGEAVAEQLALALDPYPRAANAELERTDRGDGSNASETRASPFAVLASLKGRE